MPGEEVKQRLRTGTVVTTDDRNWELRYSASALRFNLSRAVAIDMESATIAAQGYRFRVPYGTLLCVSDKPLHGKSNFPARQTVSMKARFPNTCKLAFVPSIYCVRKAINCTPVNCVPSTSRRSANN
jgi:nucleoside phosphorylase